MKPLTLVTAAALFVIASPAQAHHVVSTSGIAWVEPLTVLEVDARVAMFDFGGEYRGDWQSVAVLGEVAIGDRLSLAARVPWAHLHLADGRRAVGLSDIEGSVKARLFASPHGGFMASGGVGTALPTGSTRVGLGAGHFEISPFLAASAQPNQHLVFDGLATQKFSLGRSEPTTAGPHGALVAPHAQVETLLQAAGAAVVGRWYARVGLGTAIAWSSPMDSVFATADLGFALPGRFRLVAGGTLPVAGYKRFTWQSRVSVAMQFN